jgi:hypothetical protein
VRGQFLIDLSLLPVAEQKVKKCAPYSDDAIIRSSLKRGEDVLKQNRPTLSNYILTITRPAGALELTALTKFMDVSEMRLVHS